MPSIIAIGDSWFWYPFPGGSLLNQLGLLVAGKQHTVLAFGNNEAEAYDYVYGKYAKSVREALRLFNDGSLSAVFISGGGNDFAGFNDLRPLLNGNCSAAGSTDEPHANHNGRNAQELSQVQRQTGLECLLRLLEELDREAEAEDQHENDARERAGSLAKPDRITVPPE